MYGLDIDMDLPSLRCPSTPSALAFVQQSTHSRIDALCSATDVSSSVSTSTTHHRICTVREFDVDCLSSATTEEEDDDGEDSWVGIRTTLTPFVPRWELDKCEGDEECEQKVRVERLARVGDKVLGALKKPGQFIYDRLE
jgi:hypothetical protein